jgi:hypothetical protein
MKTKSITLLALLLLGTLTLAGCGLFHHGSRRCNTPCEMNAGQQPCLQQENCVKAGCNKPCCEKMKATETPAQ